MAKELVYGSCPSRLVDKKEEIMRFVASFGKACLHPFNALPYQYFEGGTVGREESLKYCCRLVNICDEFWIFGISEGTLIETKHFLDQNCLLKVAKPLKVYIEEFDPEWQEYYQIYLPRFSLVLQRLLLSP